VVDSLVCRVVWFADEYGLYGSLVWCGDKSKGLSIYCILAFF